MNKHSIVKLFLHALLLTLFFAFLIISIVHVTSENPIQTNKSKCEQQNGIAVFTDSGTICFNKSAIIPIQK